MTEFSKSLGAVGEISPKKWPNRKNLTFENPMGHGESNSDP
jgi:hypothetical protein